LAMLAGLHRTNWLGAADAVLGRLSTRVRGQPGIPVERLAVALYRAILGREPDSSGLDEKVRMLRAGVPLEDMIRGFLASSEFHGRVTDILVPRVALPDLTQSIPDHYETPIVRDGSMPVYVVRADADMELMESLIQRHRYYDGLGVWSPFIDLDKEITAALVRGLGAHSCFELGCYTGPVLSLLAEAGVDVLGAEVSHTAFVFAYPNIRHAMIYGDLLTIGFDRRFDVVLCMDVLEHISPLRLDAYIERLALLVDDDGYLYLNSPMWGTDRVFGMFEEQYIEEWRRTGDSSYWRHWPCDSRGWPIHGHLVWASPVWWERTFESHGLVRDVAIEQAVHARLGGFFEEAIGRRCLFVLRRPGNRKSSSDVAAAVSRSLGSLPGLR
jgi:SAM-dependent methyltransferase